MAVRPARAALKARGQRQGIGTDNLMHWGSVELTHGAERLTQNPVGAALVEVRVQPANQLIVAVEHGVEQMSVTEVKLLRGRKWWRFSPRRDSFGVVDVRRGPRREDDVPSLEETRLAVRAQPERRAGHVVEPNVDALAVALASTDIYRSLGHSSRTEVWTKGARRGAGAGSARFSASEKARDAWVSSGRGTTGASNEVP